LNAGRAETDDEHVFRLLYPGLRKFAAVVAPIEEDPDDLVQEALVKALELGGLSRVDNPGAYLRRTMTNLASNRRRQLGRGRAARRRLGARVRHDPVYPHDLALLDELAPLDRAVLYLLDVESWPAGEVAAMVGLSDNAVRLRASRARRHLRNTLRGE